MPIADGLHVLASYSERALAGQVAQFVVVSIRFVEFAC